MSPTTEKVIARCSFCGQPNLRVKKLIAGPGIFICDECVGLCREILQAEVPAAEPEAAASWQDIGARLGIPAGAAASRFGGS